LKRACRLWSFLTSDFRRLILGQALDLLVPVS
jgi:hypothetical protein